MIVKVDLLLYCNYHCKDGSVIIIVIVKVYCIVIIIVKVHLLLLLLKVDLLLLLLLLLLKVDLLLSDYEEVAAQAVDNGIDLTTQASSW